MFFILATPYTNGYYSSEDESTSDEDDDDEVDYLTMFTTHLRSKQDNRKNKNGIFDTIALTSLSV